ncbi:hypothetical protein RED65_02028 [Oceanobacter sp. RED65]|uniref:Uncharacterized protein n=1 Tax=Bermanella marisrubri TaxID=207949 RepID=Q1MY18_9GAMM|nr:hypothetical protein RED65_02028 [Oceanobacter sp. RED65] [Bermanella marisrubri]
MFTIVFYGLDNTECSKDCNTLCEAQYEAATLTESGCHTVSINDDNGNEYEF